MRKKYELTDITMVNAPGITLHRIRSLKDFQTIDGAYVKAGDLGGWIESENNLSQKGNCWVADDSQVFGNARVCGNAKVFGMVRVYENAKIRGNALIGEKAAIYGSAEVYETSVIIGRVLVTDYAHVYGSAHLSGNSYILGKSKVHGHARLSGDILVYGSGEIHGCAILGGKLKIGDFADILSTNQVLSIGPIGFRCDTTTFYRSSDDDIWVSCGCFNGNISKFKKAVKDTHGKNKFGKEYMRVIQFACEHFSLSKYSSSKVTRMLRLWKEGIIKG